MTEIFIKYTYESFINRLNELDAIPKSIDDKYAFVINHLGLGDMICMIGAVRFIAKHHKKVIVVVKNHYLESVKSFYRDLDNIIYFNIVGDPELMPFIRYREVLERIGFNVFSAGCHYYNPAIYEFPNCFYDNFDLPRKYRNLYFYVERMPEGKERYEIIKKNAPPDGYIIFHQQSSCRTINISDQFDKNKYLLLDLNKNLYSEDHIFYPIADLVVNKPIISHMELFENANELHLIESSIYCFACHLDLSKVNKKIVYIFTKDWSTEKMGPFSMIQM